MVWQNSVFPLLIIPAGVPGTGLYVYNGAPGPGNPPIAYMASDGVGVDPYGNPLPTLGGGVVSNNPGVAFSELTGGGIALGLTGSPHSAINGTIQIGLVGTGQSVQIGSGVVGADTASLLYLNDSTVATGAFRSGLQVSDGKDNQIYNTEHKRLQATGASQTVNSVSDAPIAGLQRAVGIGQYHFSAKVVWTQGGVASNQKIGFTGPAASQGLETILTTDTATIGNADTRSSATLVTMTIGAAAFGATDVFVSELDGIATFTAAGTLSVGVACTVAANTFQVNSPYCWLDVDPM